MKQHAKSPHIAKNVIFNYIGQFYLAVIGIVMTPVYIRHLGVESYGIIAFYTMLQGWLQLLDMGFSATINRQTAQYRGNSLSGDELCSLFKALQCIFISVACLIGVCLCGLSNYIASDWLNIEYIDVSDVVDSIRLIAIMVALRWMSGLYRGLINGFEEQLWLNKFNVIFASLKFVVVVYCFSVIGRSVVAFLMYQLVCTVLETSILVAFSHRLLPVTSSHFKIRFDIIKKILPFSLSIAFTSSIWVCVTQLDKLLLSKILSLTDYGYFSLAVVVSGGIMTLTTPIGVALLPRLAKLVAEKQ